MIRKSSRKIFSFTLVIIFYIIITIIIFNRRLLNIGSSYGMPDVDTDGALWYYWAQVYSDTHGINFDFTNEFLSYPFGYDVSYIPFFSLIYEINIFFIKLLGGGGWNSIVLMSNISTLVAYILSAFSAYLLAFYLTKKHYASFIGGLIFGFSFYFILMGRGALAHNHLEFIPLYFLSLFYFLDKKTTSSLVISGLTFTILFMSNPYWTFFSGIFSFIIILFYTDNDFIKKMMLLFKYYSLIILILILTNINYVYSMLYVFNRQTSTIAGRVFVPENQVVSLLSFFSPSQNNWLYPWGFGDNFLGYTALFLGLSGFLLLRKSRLYLLSSICFLISILLASNIPGLFFINKIYFEFFGMFRAVSRLNIFSTLFLSLMVALVIQYAENKYIFLFKNNKLLIILVMIFLSSLIVAEGLNKDPTWLRTTDFSKIAKLYEPIKNNSDIKVIVGYPMILSNGNSGFPPMYELLGQIIHNKPLAGGASPFMKLSLDYHSNISDISNPKTIDVLAKHGVDTIIIYNNIINNKSIIDYLKKDRRLKFIGRYTQPFDNAPYISANDLSRDIFVFQIKQVVDSNNKNKYQGKILSNDILFQQVSPIKYKIFLKNISSDRTLLFKEPFDKGWKLYLLPNPSNTWCKPLEYYENNKITVCDRTKKFFEGEDLTYIWKKPIFDDVHIRAIEYANGWTIKPEYIKANYPKEFYKENLDGSIDIELILYFKQKSYFYLGHLISELTFIGCVGYLFWDYKKKAK